MIGAAEHLVKRRTDGAWVNGEYVAGADMLFTVVGSLQPVTGRELELIPEEIKARATFKLYLAEGQPKLEVAGQFQDLSDMVQVQGQWFEIHAMQPFDAGLTPGFSLQHRKFLLVGPASPESP